MIIPENRQEIAKYSFEHTVKEAAKKFKVSTASVVAYRKRYNPEGAPKVDVPENNKRAMLQAHVNELITSKTAEIEVLKQLLKSL